MEHPGDSAGFVGFKSHLWPAVLPGEGACLVSHQGVTALRGTSAEVLVPLLDGTLTPRDVAQAAASTLSAEEVGDALAVLTGAGLLHIRPAAEARVSPARRAAEAYWELAGLDGVRASDRVARAAVRVLAPDGAPRAGAELREACRAAGLRVGPAEGPAEISLVLCDDYLSPALRGVDARHRREGVPWLPVRVDGPELWIGPVFRRPGSDGAPAGVSGDGGEAAGGACWNCLAERLLGHRRAELTVQRALRLDRPVPRPGAGLAAGRAIGLHLAALTAAKWLAGLRLPEQDAVVTVDTVSTRTAVHPVRRRPQCPDCGDASLVTVRGWQPVVLRSRRRATEDSGGGHRALSPAQMLERHGHLVGPVTGIVKEIRRSGGAPEFTQSYVSGANLAMASETLAGLSAGLRALSGGKGLTAEEARVGALCEAVERHSASRQGDEPVVRDSYRALGEVALHPNDCQLFHDRQFAERERWNARRSPFSRVPERFDENAVVDWSPVWSLTGGGHRLLPTSMLYYTSATTAPHEPVADSNGNAAGASLEDAVLQGLFELVERDAVALWWYNRTRQPGIRLGAFDEPYIERLRQGHRSIGREVWALDLTSDLGIPVVAALSARTDKPEQDIVFGFGAHFDPRIALRRALTELGQLLPAVADVRRDSGGYRVHDPEALAWWTKATVENQPYLRADPHLAQRTPSSWSYAPRDDLRDELRAVTDVLAGAGLETFVLDQTRPDIGVPVAKVVVPGLRHFWARFAPGRLYDVPVALGRREKPVPYTELNPIPLFV
ncbi:TOMM precursor leader peptide-binding protein [Streptomyces sp. NPDC056817]|uniref:TOMM precursor leader peptide-binding protein n=1 Tax=Streptomyces sp. NPDC056817 TaxID=3345950 RepID=UPI0036C4859F